MKYHTFYIALLILIVSCNGAESELFQATLDSGGLDLINSPVFVEVNNPDLNDNDVLCVSTEAGVIPAQVQSVSDTEKRIWWHATQPAGEVVIYSFSADGDCYEQVYTWASVGDFSTQLQFGNQPLMQYEHPAYNPDEIEQTKKPFHHLFDPSGGELITKGPGGLYHSSQRYIFWI